MSYIMENYVLALWSRSSSKLYKNSIPTAKKTLFHCKDQLINAVSGNNSCLFRESYETHKYRI
jgi:hypothetical protein